MQFYNSHFERNDYTVLKLFPHINSDTVHLHGEFDDDILLQNWVRHFHCQNTYRRKTVHLKTYLYRTILTYFDVLNQYQEYCPRVTDTLYTYGVYERNGPWCKEHRNLVTSAPNRNHKLGSLSSSHSAYYYCKWWDVYEQSPHCCCCVLLGSLPSPMH